MSADLSLSGSLGGLRIANPDEEPTSSPASSPPPGTSRPPPPASHSSASTVTESRRPSLFPLSTPDSFQSSSSLDFDPNTYGLQATGTSPSFAGSLARSPMHVGASTSPVSTHRPGQALAQQAAAAALYNTSAPMRQSSVQGSTARPSIAMYAQQGSTSSSGVLPGTYRYGGEVATADGSLGGLTRTGSRSHRPNIGVKVGREYRQASIPTSSNAAQIPGRRNSQRGRAPTGTSSPSAGHDASDMLYGQESSLATSAEQWRERGAAVAVRTDVDSAGQTQTRVVKKGVKDFKFGRTLGEGSYSTVLAAIDRQTLKEYAVKVLDKRHIIKEKKVKYVNIERDTLNRLTEHPGIVRLYYTFQDERSLYFVLDLASSGELLGVLKKLGSFDVECTRFYGAEILDSIAYMHTRGVIHRDLKPENVLLDRDMHVKITDFGTAKILPDPRPQGTNGVSEHSGDPTDGQESDRAVSFVGTAEYVSPELLRDKNACKASDLWAFGCIIFQLLAGRPPFKAANEYLTFQKILALDYVFPPGFPESARDLVERLLVLEPANRLPVEHIRNHHFFEGVQWGRSLWRQTVPTLKAHIPPANEPIRLNGPGATHGAAAALQAAHIAASGMSAVSPPAQPSSRRPQLLKVTELPPPSQLDIDWSPVLTHNNERILKLGNLIFSTGQAPPSPKSGESAQMAQPEKTKFSRLFSGNVAKRKERLILITSAARLVVAAAGGNEKKAKLEINLAAHVSQCKTCTDSKGLVYFSIDSKDKHYAFEDPRATTADPAGSQFSTQEWLSAIEQAREIAIATSGSYSSYGGESLVSVTSSPAESVGGDGTGGPAGENGAGGVGGSRHMLRHTLRKNTDEMDSERGMGPGGPGGGSNVGGPLGAGRKRFSKRHSKSGLAAVF